MFVLIYIILVSLLYWTFYRIKHLNRFECARTLGGPPSYPLIGNVLMYLDKKPEDLYQMMIDLQKKYGKLFRVWIGPQLALFASDPKDVELVLSSTRHITKSNLYDFLIPWLGTGLLLSTTPKWNNRRKVLTPAFHFKILEQFVEIFERNSDILVSRLHKVDAKQEFNIYPYISMCALDVICETAMGTKINAQTNTESEYVKAVHTISHILAYRFIRVLLRNEIIFKLFGREQKRRQDEAIRVMHKFTKGIIAERREYLSKAPKKQFHDKDGIGIKEKMALLDVLLQSTIDGKPLSDEDIREEVDTFMFEGHDTTTSAISFSLYLISRHPEVQNKLFKEIKEVIGTDKNKPTTYRQLQDLKYMEQVIKESLRLFPPVPIIARRLKEDATINNVLIPAETNFTIGIFVMLKDPELYANPEEFIPERFDLDKTNETKNPFSYIPFSAGSRNCIGQKFALLEIKSTISKILQHFELLPEGPKPIPLIEIVLRSQNGIHLGLKQRMY